MESPASVGIFRAWYFRIFLLLGVLVGFGSFFDAATDRFALSMRGVSATITLASPSEKLPAEGFGWLNNQHDFRVKATTSDGKESVFTVFLPRQVIEDLVNGGQAGIIYARNNPRFHIMKGEPYPPFGFGWLTFGVVALAVFVLSLRLK